jgi:hypothetical protein
VGEQPRDHLDRHARRTISVAWLWRSIWAGEPRRSPERYRVCTI